MGGRRREAGAAGFVQGLTAGYTNDMQRRQAFEDKVNSALYGKLLNQSFPTMQVVYQQEGGLLKPIGQVQKGSQILKTPLSGVGVTPPEDVQAVASGISQGIIPPNPNEISFRDRTRVNAELSRKGLDLTKLNIDWTAMQAYARNSNSSQQLRMRQALESVKQGVPSLRQLNDQFNRFGWTPANAVELKAALTGTDPTKRDLATKFITQINVMKDELAQGFMGGGVPTDRAFALADQIISPVYGSKQMNSALDQLETNLAVRSNAISSVPPTMLGGKVSKQYEELLPPATPANSAGGMLGSSPVSSGKIEAGLKSTPKGNRYRIIQ